MVPNPGRGTNKPSLDTVNSRYEGSFARLYRTLERLVGSFRKSCGGSRERNRASGTSRQTTPRLSRYQHYLTTHISNLTPTERTRISTCLAAWSCATLAIMLCTMEWYSANAVVPVITGWVLICVSLAGLNFIRKW